MKSLLLFWRTVQVELGTWCRVSTDQDFKTVLERFENEGDNFLSVTLPEFGKDLETALDQCQVTPDLFKGFTKRQKLPVFLGGFMELIFDRKTGTILDDEGETPPLAVESIFAIRQLTLMFGKILPTDGDVPVEMQESAMREFIECEQELERHWLKSTPGSSSFEGVNRTLAETEQAFTHASRFLFRNVLSSMDSELFNEVERRSPSKDGDWRIVPAHGPGSTADHLSGNGKYNQYEWTQRLEDVFPFGEYAIPSWRSYYLLDRVKFLEPGAERPVRVVTVPKTRKKPRVIAIEPTCMQYMQQAVSRRLVDLLERDTILQGMIGFEDQVPNQYLAQLGSREGTLATLDLSEASDRVSWSLVRDSFWHPGSPFMEALDATRSRRADVPGHGIIPLTKFASMGSALTFPIEAMVFLTCVFVGIGKSLNRPVDMALVREFQSSVRVYGDDIIVPVEFATAVISVLETLGFKVNKRKSFWTGRFRESCGAEFYAGEDVSITRVRRVFPQSRHDVSEVISLISLRNALYWSGLWRSAAWLDERIVEVLPHFPIVNQTSPVEGRESAVFGYLPERESQDLHAPLVRGYVVNTRTPRSEISEEGALLKCLTSNGSPIDGVWGLLEPLQSDHLERQGRADAVRLKLRWALPY